MQSPTNDWLSYGYNVSLLLKDLEKNAIELEPVQDTSVVLASLTKQNSTHRTPLFDLTLPTNSYTSAWIASDKYYSKKFLQEKNFSVAAGKVFHTTQRDDICAYAEKLEYPVVIKPTQRGHGECVFTLLESESELLHALDAFIDYFGNMQLLVEKHVFGEEYRIFVTSKNFLAAVTRTPARVIGNGKDTIYDLIENENYRRMHPRDNCLCTIRVDAVCKQFLQKKAISLHSIPEAGEVVVLRPTSNVSMGGFCKDVTDDVHPSIRSYAFQILDSLPDMQLLGIDLICEDIGLELQEQEHAVCELNPTPGLSLHTLPGEGTSRDTISAVTELLL